MFPVVNGNLLAGCVTPKQVSSVPKEQWHQHTAGEITVPCSTENTITPETDAVKALSLMNTTGNSRLMVIENGRLVGIVTLKDMLKFLSLKVNFGGIHN